MWRAAVKPLRRSYKVFESLILVFFICKALQYKVLFWGIFDHKGLIKSFFFFFFLTEKEGSALTIAVSSWDSTYSISIFMIVELNNLKSLQASLDY